MAMAQDHFVKQQKNDKNERRQVHQRGRREAQLAQILRPAGVHQR